MVAAILLTLFRGKKALVLLCAAYVGGCALGFMDGLGLVSLDFIPSI
jgi:hypothetical protein